MLIQAALLVAVQAQVPLDVVTLTLPVAPDSSTEALEAERV
jgi:hypothetical protein